jgi:hypothetical protein
VVRVKARLPTVEAASTRTLARFYQTEADLCGCTHLSRAARLCHRRARKLDQEARKAA